MAWHSRFYRHKHSLGLEKVSTGIVSGLMVYHFRCRDAGCHWPVWCYKYEFWGREGN